MEAPSLAQRCLHTIARAPRCMATSQLRSSLMNSTRLASHFPARRKGHAGRLTRPIRTFSTSQLARQDPSLARAPPPPPTAPKPSIMGDLTQKLRTQGDGAVAEPRRPLAEQLDIFNWDIMDVMGSDPKKRPPPSTLSSRGADSDGVDQEGLYHNLASTTYRQSDLPPVILRLKPTLGRTQELDLTRNIDLTAAFRRVERKCVDNSVKVDARNQRIYVRRGQRRKDERRRRWRALFKAGFLHECARIRRMKKQGW